MQDEMSADDIISNSQQVTKLVVKHFENCPALSKDQRLTLALAASQAVMKKLSDMFLT